MNEVPEDAKGAGMTSECRSRDSGSSEDREQAWQRCCSKLNSPHKKCCSISRRPVMCVSQALNM